MNKEVDKQVKSLSAKVKELEERAVYLTRENNELRKQKNDLELEIRREKQITNLHLKLTNELSAAKEALKDASHRGNVETQQMQDQQNRNSDLQNENAFQQNGKPVLKNGKPEDKNNESPQNPVPSNSPPLHKSKHS